eukprot:1695376-Amphidinium_carterae.1
MRGPGATEDRETVEEYNEEREIDNAYSEIDEFKETMEYSEHMQQTLRLCNEMEEMTIAMIKMNIKLPTPTMYDGKSPQFNEWSEVVRSCLTVHNIHIDDLLDDSTRSQVPM